MRQIYARTTFKTARIYLYPCEPFERTQKFRETCNLKHLYRNELDKTCFAYNAAYSDSKDLDKRTISDKILKDRAYEIARNCNYNGCQRALANTWSITFLITKQDRERQKQAKLD